MKKKSFKYNLKDKDIWERVFSNIPMEWKKVGPSDSMLCCLDFFQKHNVKSALDLGCGVGIWSIFLAKNGISIKGVDFSKNAIDYANNWANEEKINAIFDYSDLVNHSFKKEAFDGIIASKILDNVSRVEFSEISQQIESNLNYGGILFCVFNPYLTETDNEKLMKSDNPTKGITHTIYKDKELEKIFPKLTLLEFRTFEHGFRGLIWKK